MVCQLFVLLGNGSGSLYIGFVFLRSSLPPARSILTLQSSAHRSKIEKLSPKCLLYVVFEPVLKWGLVRERCQLWFNRFSSLDLSKSKGIKQRRQQFTGFFSKDGFVLNVSFIQFNWSSKELLSRGSDCIDLRSITPFPHWDEAAQIPESLLEAYISCPNRPCYPGDLNASDYPNSLQACRPAEPQFSFQISSTSSIALAMLGLSASLSIFALSSFTSLEHRYLALGPVMKEASAQKWKGRCREY
eukprot:Gb_10851 [translate_table: standard]